MNDLPQADTSVLPGATVLVTGAAGVIGRTLVPALAAAGYRVVTTDRSDAVVPGALGHLVGDTRETQFVHAALRSTGQVVDAVVHLAAHSSPGQVPDDETLVDNVQGAFAVLDGAGAAGVRATVAASSFSAYGWAWAGRHISPPRVPVDESIATDAVDTYALSKVFSEQVGALVTRRWGMPTTFLRMPFVGNGERLREWVDAARRDPAALAQELWTWLDTRDATDAVLGALRSGSSSHHVLNVAAPDTTSPVPTAELFARYHPATAGAEGLVGCASPIDSSAAHLLIGFVARRSWRDGDALVPAAVVAR